MGYGFTCNQCGDKHPDSDPALMAQIHERWFRTSQQGGVLAEHGVEPDETITLCGDCAIELLLDY